MQEKLRFLGLDAFGMDCADDRRASPRRRKRLRGKRSIGCTSAI
jgi:hypothetical protein